MDGVGLEGIVELLKCDITSLQRVKFIEGGLDFVLDESIIDSFDHAAEILDVHLFLARLIEFFVEFFDFYVEFLDGVDEFFYSFFGLLFDVGLVLGVGGVEMDVPLIERAVVLLEPVVEYLEGDLLLVPG